MSFASSNQSTETLGRGLELLDRGMSALNDGVKQELDDPEEIQLRKDIEEPFFENSKCFPMFHFFAPNTTSICSFLPKHLRQIIVLSPIFMNPFFQNFYLKIFGGSILFYL